ncbi:MAG: NUDIX domain-containing protein [Chloroflexi bacterium]|nr:MAG: NUDIX domain-containing protein [Chloroflexota bacterium]
MQPRWLNWVQRLQAIAQNGLAYEPSMYDRERYEQIQEIAAEIAASHTDTDAEIIQGIYNGEVGHATPKVDVRAVVFCDDKILLVKEIVDGGWTLPGGWVDVGESPSVAAARETFEESGFEVRPVKLLAIYDRAKHDHPPHAFHIYKLFFLCDLIGGEAKHSDETDGVDFFSRDAIPPLSTGRVTSAQIAHFFAHREHPEWPTDFD